MLIALLKAPARDDAATLLMPFRCQPLFKQKCCLLHSKNGNPCSSGQQFSTENLHSMAPGTWLPGLRHKAFMMPR